MSTATTSNAAIVRAEVEAINAGDTATMRQLWAPDGVCRFPDRTAHGIAEIEEYFAGVRAGIPDFKLTILAIVEDGDTVFMHWRAEGTHDGGRFQGIAPTGKRLSVDGMDQFTVTGGRIASNFVVFDQMDFGRQLGLLPPDGSAPDR